MPTKQLTKCFVPPHKLREMFGLKNWFQHPQQFITDLFKAVVLFEFSVACFW